MSELTTPIRIDIPGIGSIESADLYLKSEADKVIAELEKEIDELQGKVTEAFMQSQRVLWLARAERAKDRAITYDDFAYLGDTERNISMTLARTWMKCRLLKPSEWSKVWKKVERKCRAKAEEYK